MDTITHPANVDAPPRRDDESRADALLAVRCQLGERAAFDDLIRRWAQPLRRYVVRVTGNSEAADELVQDIWLRVLQGIGRLQEPAKLRAWLFGIAHRRVMDRLREQYAAPVTDGGECIGVGAIGDRHGVLLAQAIHHAAVRDAEQPGAQLRRFLQAADALQHAQPDVLHQFVGDRKSVV